MFAQSGKPCGTTAEASGKHGTAGGAKTDREGAETGEVIGGGGPTLDLAPGGRGTGIFALDTTVVDLFSSTLGSAAADLGDEAALNFEEGGWERIETSGTADSGLRSSRRVDLTAGPGAQL